MNWKKLLAYITGSVDEELLLRNERKNIRKSQLPLGFDLPQIHSIYTTYAPPNSGRTIAQREKKAIEGIGQAS